MSFGSINALCIDLDGTLVDSHDFLYIAFQKFMQQKGVPDSREAFEALIGPSLKELIEKLKIQYGWEEDVDELLENYRTTLHDLSAQHVKLFPHVKEALHQFKDWGLKLAVVTSAYRKYTDKILKDHQIIQYFNVIVTPEDSGFVSKPNGVIYQRAVQKLNVAPSQALAIEDSFTGITSAMNAGLPVCYLSHGKSVPDKVQNKQVTILNGWKDILEQFRKIYG